jgi:hypothetical protein
MDLLSSFLLWLSAPHHGYALLFAASFSVYLVLAVQRGRREAAAARLEEDAATPAVELAMPALPEAGPAEPA